MSKYPRLQNRNGTYYIRVKVPNDVRDALGKSEIRYSLKTKDYREAIRKLAVESIKVDKQIDVARSSVAVSQKAPVEELTEDQLKYISTVYYAYLLEEDDDTRLEHLYHGEQKAIPSDSPEEYQESIEGLHEVNAQSYGRGIVQDFFYDEAVEVCSWDGIELNLKEGTASHKRLAMELQKASIRAYKVILDRNKGEIIETPRVELQASANTNSSPLLSVIMEEWIEERKTTGQWGDPKTEMFVRASFDHFMELLGDKPLSDYTKADARAFKAALMSMPTSYKTKKQTKDLSFKAACALAKKGGLDVISDATKNKHLTFYSNLWKWYISHYDDVDLNIFDGLHIRVKKNVRVKRDPFSNEELKAIFKSPLYVGCDSLQKPYIKGSYDMSRTALYWCPLISLYHGMRMNEILQLYIEDIAQSDDGIYYFKIGIEEGQTDKRIKTATSHRNIPIHPKVIEMGFLEYYEEVKQKGSIRLFPDTSLSKTALNYSDAFSKKFNRFLKNIGVKQGKNCFHSFRHNFEDGCRNNGVPKDIMDALQGHSTGDMSDVYGKGYSIKVLHQEIRKVGYVSIQ